MKSSQKVLLLAAMIGLMVPGRAGANVGIVNGLTHEAKAGPGQTYETVIIVKNFGDQQARIKVYQADYHFYSDGRQLYSEPGKLERSNADWITFYPRNELLSPQESVELKCVVNIPEEGALCGTYWSLLMVEPVPDTQTGVDAAQKEQVSYGINQVLRYAIQIITHIQETGIRQIKFADTVLMKEDERTILQVDVENTGERWLRPVLYVELYGEQGEHMGKYEGGKWRIYPGTSVRYRVDLKTLNAGNYKAMIIVDNLDEYVFGAEYDLKIQSVGPVK